MDNYVDTIMKSRLFTGLSEKETRDVINCLTYSVKQFHKGQVIALEGNEIRYIGIVLKGSVDMVKEDLWGNRNLLTRMEEGELFGETFACGLVQESVVTFISVGESLNLILPFHRVIKTCSNRCHFHEKVIRNMVTTITEKNKSLMLKLEIITKKTLREKILAYLSQQVQIQNSRYIQIPLNRGELADYLCSNRSALIRELARMKQEKLIDYDRSTFVILS